MESERTAPESAPPPAWSRGQAAYAVAQFSVACAVLAAATWFGRAAFTGVSPEEMLFFLLFGLFTIAIGYEHPNVGYFSFDRVSQVASILVLGPVAAAWVNGAASLLYPWHRLRQGVPLRDVCLASVHNAGLMALVVLACGSLYAVSGGAIPLQAIDARSATLLIVLVLSMQVLNDLGMLGVLKAGRRDTTGFFQPFSVALELGSGATAVLVALVYNAASLQVFVVLLGVLSLGMVGLQQFARMRLRLERIVDERTESLREKTRELEQLAMQDNLTGLFNRRYADAYLEQQLARADGNGRYLSIALADIDRFKQINDLHSHATGDEVIKTVADTLRRRCRRTDMLARYGGEEFLICFPETDGRQARRLCEELRMAVEQHDWSSIDPGIGVTISFGVAECGQEPSAASLVHSADLRLYAAKDAGRNSVAV